MLDRGNPDDYHWFCLRHVRDYNKSWNFFDGMSDDEVLKYKDDDITGHRPTWKMGSRTATIRPDHVYDDPFEFRKETENPFSGFQGDSHQNNQARKMDAKEREALATLNLTPGCTLKEIKRRHKELAKKYHPDTRGGDKQAEEILKNINQAYTHLLSCGNS
ncbi:hypothetical protein GCM10007924_08410 [Sneathiella chinensis]|uniref:J domain-containing protein n=2 Tax=Sneathiella chinensis TaxID=349750 RepID=A0ABQ5U359_9PROT|nr:hypothetical protein GCM10007924_08410 [Sneathiella chinensis]